MTVSNLLKHWVLLISLAAISACTPADPQQRAEKYYESGLEKFQSEKYNAAVIELKNALQEKADFIPARLLLGRLYLQNYQITAARKEYERAKEAGAAPSEYLVPLMRVYNLGREFPKALGLVEAAAPDLARDPDVMAYHADALLGQGRVGDAQDLLQSAPAQTAGILARLGQIALSQNETEKAASLSQQALEAGPKQYEANLLAGRMAIMAENRDQAEGYLRTALKADPASPLATISLASLLIEQGGLDEALGLLDDLRQRGLSSEQSIYLRSLIALQQQKFEIAKTESERVLASNPRSRSALLVAGIANSALGNDQIAINNLQRFAKESIGDDNVPEVASRALAWSNLRLGNPSDALAAIAPLASTGGAGEDNLAALRLATAAAVQSGKMDQAIGYLENALGRTPDNLALATALASLKLGIGDKAGAEAALKPFSNGDQLDSVNDRMRLGVTYARAGNLDEAMTIANALITDHPERAAGYFLKGLVHGTRGESAEGIDLIEKANALEPYNQPVIVALIRLYREQGRQDKAIGLIETALKKAPESAELKLGLAQLLAESGQNEKVEALLRDVVAQYPEQQAYKLALGRYLLANGQEKEALDLAKGILKANPDQTEAMELAGLAEQIMGDSAAALQRFDRLVALNPENARNHVLLARSLVASGRIDDAIASLRESIRLNDEYNNARAILARLLAEKGQTKEADDLLVELESRLGATPDFLELKAEIFLRLGEQAKAAAAMERAHAQAPTEKRALSLSQILWSIGEKEKALAALEGMETLESNLQRAQLLSQMGEKERAAQLYDAVLDKNPENPVLLNNYAWLLWEMGRTDQAFQLASKARRLAPKSASIQDTYGVISLSRGNLGQALAAHREAYSLAPDNPDIQMNLAKALLENGNKEEVQTLLADLGRKIDPARRDEVAELLKKARQ
ncbi:UDP-N-acetylglucosamine--peptide N-acetylglucosaminyltransferase 110 kDa subunit [alpha proteobacterium Q-1]|nr:UDP-N-acetylglucosamine--peptide N-acetylglucosaminyltransferase 110 kDa subunit [alpha proteobacterium Q-1]